MNTTNSVWVNQLTDAQLLMLKISELDQQVATLTEALENLLELGRKDHSNPKYDGYYESARAALAAIRREK